MARQPGQFTQDFISDPWGYNDPWSGGYSDPWGSQQDFPDTEYDMPQSPTEPPPPPPPPGEEEEEEPAPPDTSGWDTDGYSIPGFTSSGYNQSAFSGWDQSKWDDPTHQTPKYVVGRIMASHPNTPEGRAAMIADIQKAYPGATFNGKDRINIPGLGEIDIFGGASNGEFRPQWYDVAAAAADEASQPPPPSYGGGSGGQYGPVNGGGLIPSGSGGYGYNGGGSSSSGTRVNFSTSGYQPPAGVSDELWNMLLTRAKQGLDVDRTNPAVRSQADAYTAQEDRARRNYLADLAEKSSPYGTGAQAGAERMTAAGVGQRTGAFESELIGREITARRQEIQHALDTMGNLLTEQQRLALQYEIAQMDDSLERLKSDRQNSQFYSGLSQQDRHFNLDDRFRYANLNQQQSQFLDRLGFDVQREDNYWDWKQRGND